MGPGVTWHWAHRNPLGKKSQAGGGHGGVQLPMQPRASPTPAHVSCSAAQILTFQMLPSCAAHEGAKSHIIISHILSPGFPES